MDNNETRLRKNILWKVLPYVFTEIRLLEDKDISLMRVWLNKKHVIKWYEKPDEWLAELYRRFDVFGFIKHYIVDYNCKPIGFCQYYSCSDAQETRGGQVPCVKPNLTLRNSIHRAYGKKCFYCGEKINMHQLEIAHILPSSDKDMPDTIELQDYLQELSNKSFIKDCIANYLPSCSHCNKQKSKQYFSIGNLRYFHEQALKNSNKVVKQMELFSYADDNPEKEAEIRKLSKGKEYIQEKIILESSRNCAYSYGLGSARISAFIPISIEQELSCLISFKQIGLSDCMFSFDESDIKFYFFNGYRTGLTALSIIFDDLYVEFYKRRNSLLNTIGATYFQEAGRGKFSILRVPKTIWIAMVDFAQQHDHIVGDTEWDIFHSLNLIEKNHIIIYNNHLNVNKADILAELYVSDMSGNYVDILWKSGHTPS